MINKVTLIGHAGGDPEMRTLDTGAHVSRFSLATNESYKDKLGEWQTSTEWHNVILWREQAERAAQQIKKGSTVYIEGKISYRKYTDKDGVEKTFTDIVANTFRLLEKRDRSDNRFPDTDPGNEKENAQDIGNPNLPQMNNPIPPPNPVKNQFGDVPNSDANGGDDLPF